MNKKVVKFSVGLSVFLFGIMSVSAIVGGTVTRSLEIMPISALAEDVDPVNTSTCIDLQSNGLRYRANDASANGEVSVLQDFLISKGFLKTEATGFFGLGTFSAVKQFQKKQGLSPTGYVGPLTKVKIKEQSCSLGKSEAQDPSLPRETLGKPVACTMEARMCPDGTMMPRDPATCKWLESKCQGVGQSSLPPKQVGIRPGVISQEEQQRVYVCEKSKMACDNTSTNYNGFACKELTLLCEKFSANQRNDGTEINPQNVFPIKKVVATSSIPRGCGTMEIRYCPNGAMMERDSQTCAWLTASCTASSTKIQPSYRYGYDPLPPIRPVDINPAKQLIDTRNASRNSAVNTILNAITQYSVDNNGVLPSGITLVPTEICSSSITSSCTGLVDLSVLTIGGKYVTAIPNEPQKTNVNGAGYLVSKNANGRITVSAQFPENGATISVTR